MTTHADEASNPEQGANCVPTPQRIKHEVDGTEELGDDLIPNAVDKASLE
jgi:hypothetical protein